MKIALTLVLLALSSSLVWAQEDEMADRDPAAVSAPLTSVPGKNFPGGVDEEDLRVNPTIAEAPIAIDTRTVQRQVFKDLFKKELKDDRAEANEEEN